MNETEAGRDVLREAGIAWRPAVKRADPYGHGIIDGEIIVRRADVERIVRERGEAWADYFRLDDELAIARRELEEARLALDKLAGPPGERASAPQTAGREVTEVLDAAENKLRQMAREFMGPNFTDRYDDGPAMLKIAERIAALRAAGTAGEPAPLLSGKFTDSHLRSLKLMVAFHEANAEHVGGFDHVTQAKQAIALLGEALHPTDPAGSVPASGAKAFAPADAAQLIAALQGFDPRFCVVGNFTVAEFQAALRAGLNATGQIGDAFAQRDRHMEAASRLVLDKDRLAAVERNQWSVQPDTGGCWTVWVSQPTGGGDHEEVELTQGKRHRRLRAAIDAAMQLREAAQSGVLPPNAPDSPVSRPSVGGGE